MTKLRVIFVTGDREWTDEMALRRVFATHAHGAWLLHGGCRGADLLADLVSRDFGFQTIRMEAGWGYYSKQAGPIRNRAMGRLLAILHDAGADITCYAVHNDLEHSKGTKDMVAVLESHGLAWNRVTSQSVG